MDFDLKADCIDLNGFEYELSFNKKLKWIHINNIETEVSVSDKCFPNSGFLQLSFLDKAANKESKFKEYDLSYYFKKYKVYLTH